jgi:hypothetical protein
MDRLLEVEQTVGSPKDEEIEQQRYCPNCYDGNGSLCIQCEMDGLFRVRFSDILIIYLLNDLILFFKFFCL